MCIGSGLRSSKLIVSGGDVLSLPGAEVVAMRLVGAAMMDLVVRWRLSDLVLKAPT